MILKPPFTSDILARDLNSLISETRHKITLESIPLSLKKYGKGEFTKAKVDLSGEEFKGYIGEESRVRLHLVKGCQHCVKEF